MPHEKHVDNNPAVGIPREHNLIRHRSARELLTLASWTKKVKACVVVENVNLALWLWRHPAICKVRAGGRWDERIIPRAQRPCVCVCEKGESLLVKGLRARARESTTGWGRCFSACGWSMKKEKLSVHVCCVCFAATPLQFRPHEKKPQSAVKWDERRRLARCSQINCICSTRLPCTHLKVKI